MDSGVAVRTTVWVSVADELLNQPPIVTGDNERLAAECTSVKDREARCVACRHGAAMQRGSATHHYENVTRVTPVCLETRTH